MSNPTMSQRRPLEDITVLDLTTALAGPYATFLLAGLGARVIKIENPAGPDTCRANAPYIGPEGPHLTRQHPDDISVSAINRLRGKKAVTLNMKHAGSRPVFEKLVKKAAGWRDFIELRDKVRKRRNLPPRPKVLPPEPRKLMAWMQRLRTAGRRLTR